MPAKKSTAACVRRTLNLLRSACAARCVVGIILLGLLAGLMLSAKPQAATCDIHGGLGELSRLAVLTLAHRTEAHSAGQLHDPMAAQLSSALCPEWAIRPDHQAGSRGIVVASIERAKAIDLRLKPLLTAAVRHNSVTVLNVGAGMCTRYWRLQLTTVEQVARTVTHTVASSALRPADSDLMVQVRWHHSTDCLMGKAGVLYYYSRQIITHTVHPPLLTRYELYQIQSRTVAQITKVLQLLPPHCTAHLIADAPPNVARMLRAPVQTIAALLPARMIPGGGFGAAVRAPMAWGCRTTGRAYGCGAPYDSWIVDRREMECELESVTKVYGGWVPASLAWMLQWHTPTLALMRWSQVIN